MTSDEFIVELLRLGFVQVNPVDGIVYATRGPRGFSLSAPRPIGQNDRGYLRASFKIRQERRRVGMHRVVWIAVHGVPADGLCVCHRNNRKDDNRLSNLYLGTAPENSRDARRDNLYRAGDRHPSTRVTVAQRDEVRRAYEAGEGSIRSLAARFGLSKSRVQQIVSKAVA